MTDFGIEKIEAYLNNSLSEAERLAFENKLSSDTEFRQKVEDHRFIFEGLRGIEMDKFRKEVSDWEEELAGQEQERNSDTSTGSNKTTTAVVRRFNWRTFAAAAGVLFLIAAGSYYWIQQNYSTKQLLALNYEQPILPAPRAGSPTITLLSDGVAAIKRSDHQKAIQQFESIPPSAPEYIEAQFYLGHSFYAIGNTGSAITAFLKVERSNDSRFAGAAEWASILCLMRNAKYKETRSSLQEIIDEPEHRYRDKALELKADLESFWFGVVN